MDKSYSSTNSALRKQEIKKPQPIQFEDEDGVNCEDINPIISFQAEDQPTQKCDQVENTPAFPEGKPVHKTQQMFSENFGQKIMFDASEDMVFESDASDRKSVEFCNNRNVNKSGKR